MQFPDHMRESTRAFTASLTSEPQQMTIRPVERGYGSDAFEVRFADRTPLVVLQEKDSPHVKSSYPHYYVLVRLLRDQQFSSVPDEVFLSDDGLALASTFIYGVDVATYTTNHTPDENLQLYYRILDQAYDLERASYDDYLTLADTLKIAPRYKVTQYESVSSFAIDWYNHVITGCPDARLKEWCQQYVPRMLETAKHISEGNALALVHNDLSDGNIIIEDGTDRIVFIDWGAASFMPATDEYYISYMANLHPEMRSHKRELIQYAAQTRGHNTVTLTKALHEYDVYNHPVEVLWAIMMFTKASLHQVDGSPEQYKQLALQRIADYSATLNELNV